MTLPLFEVEEQKGKAHKLQELCPICKKTAIEINSVVKGNKKIITLKCFHIFVTELEKTTPYHEFITYAHRDNGCKHEWDKNTCLSCGAHRLYDFQVTGCEFVEQSLTTNRGAGIFDEPGLGKTIMPIAYFNYHPEALPALFIVKSRLKFQFFKALLTWLGPHHVAQIIQSGKDPILTYFKHYIISYDLLRNIDTTVFTEEIGIKTIVLDECQQIKNPESKRTVEVQDLVREVPHVIPTSGTPWKNRGGEFYVALNMLSPQKFPSKQQFLERWVAYYDYGDTVKQGGIRNPERFKEHIKDIAIRRERKEVLPELPTINRTIHYCQLDALEQQAYNKEVSAFVEWYNDKVLSGEDEGISSQHILAKLNIMRHITGLAKIPATVEFALDHINETGRSIVVFIHHIDVGDILYEKFVESLGKHKVFRLTGGMDAESTSGIVDAFNKADPCVAIASTLASGEGLDGLQRTCSDCILHERQWNPANEEQVEGRFIRIGQVATSVNGTYITAANTIDEHLAGIVERKRVDFHNAMNKGEMPTWNQNDIMEDLVASLGKDVSKLQKMASW